MTPEEKSEADFLHEDRLISEGWIPPVKFWLEPADTSEGEFSLVWMVQEGAPLGDGLVEIAYRDGDSWLDALGRNVEELYQTKIVRVAPEPNPGGEGADVMRLHRCFVHLRAAGLLPAPTTDEASS
jgi:hypothetical protein